MRISIRFLILLFLGLNLSSQGFAQAKRKDIGQLNQYRSCFDVKHYNISLRIKPSEHYISGCNDIQFKMVNNSNTIQLDYTEQMSIDSVKTFLPIKKYTRKGNTIRIEFNRVLLKDSSYHISLYFSGYPHVAKLPPWDGGFVWSKDKNNNDWVGLACEGIGASMWLPCKDHWSDEADGLDIRISVPKDLVAVSNGKLIGQYDEADYTAYQWQVKNPINNYNISINVGRYALIQDTFNGLNTLPLNYYVLEYNRPKAEDHFLQVDVMLKAFEHYFGQYPFKDDSYKLVETPYWGMEHQSCVAYGNNYKNNNYGFDFIIIHESGHEWFANSITAYDPADMWIHESFTTYSEALYLEYTVNKSRAVEYLLDQKKKIVYKEAMQGPRDVYYHGRKDADIYYKGTWMLHTMRNILNNDSLWFACLKEMNAKYFHQIVCTEDIIRFFNSKTPYQWDLFFKQYLYQKSIPVLEVVSKSLDNGKIQYNLCFKSDVKGLQIPIFIQGLSVVLTQKTEANIVLPQNFNFIQYLQSHYLIDIKIKN